MKSIYFPSPVADEMVRAILEGRKTVMRRVIKPTPMGLTYEDGSPTRKPPYRHGDIMYVKEAWTTWAEMRKAGATGHLEQFYYKADVNAYNSVKWNSSIHMPREAVRVFLRVTGIRVERLQEISEESATQEGCTPLIKSVRYVFADLWDRTIKRTERALYGWDGNPWVWAIAFERCEKPEEETV